MIQTMLKGKIHRAVVQQAELNYVGSITVDPELMEQAATAAKKGSMRCPMTTGSAK